MKKVSIFAFVFTLLLFIPAAMAQEVNLTPPSDVQVGSEAVITIEVLDEDGNPVTDAELDISIDPSSAADDVDLFNCADVGDSELCQPNNREGEGIYESVLLINALPVTVTISTGDAEESIRLSGTSAPAAPKTTGTTAPATPPAAAGTTVTAADVQVGPTPSFWLIMLPFLLMSTVVAYFVIKTE